jgi:hypothetical protein
MPDANPDLPAFIIGGAAKSGTSTLHEMLGRRSDVFIPDKELYLFSIDDYEQHPEFFIDRDGRWIMRDYEARQDEYLAWYRGFFRGAPRDSLLGEDSTSYLPSARAPGRIRALLPDVKLIFVLRDPAERTYSQYWHDLRVGRVVEDFEGTIRHAPGTLLQRSLYREQAARYLDLFSAAQLKFLLFEDLAREPARILQEVIGFLGLQAMASAGSDEIHRNPARVPRSIRLQLLRNRLFRDRPAARFHGFLPGMSAPSSLKERAVRGRWARFGVRHDRRPPPMRDDTRRFLDEYFAHENAGLDALVGLDVTRRWYRSAR